MKNMDREDFWIIVVTLLNVGIHFGVWFFKGSLDGILNYITANIALFEIGIIVLAIAGLAWLQYKYNFVLGAIGVYVAVVLSPFVLLWAVIWRSALLLKEKDGADINGGGYIYEKMGWPEYIKYKFTGLGRRFN